MSKCPFCTGTLTEIKDSEINVHVCDLDNSHIFDITKTNILWTPIAEDASLYFRKFDLNGVEIFDLETTENLLAVINSLNEGMREVIKEYTSLGEYVKALENKIEAYKAANSGTETTLFGRQLNKAKTTPSGIILSK